jgi:hypothetical protein
MRVWRSPMTAAVLATTGRSPGRWTLEAHGGLGIELQRLRDISLPGQPTVSRGRRFGPVAQAGLAVLLSLGDVRRGGRFSVGAVLRLVFSLAGLLVVVGVGRVGGIKAPTPCIAIVGRWTAR